MLFIKLQSSQTLNPGEIAIIFHYFYLKKICLNITPSYENSLFHLYKKISKKRNFHVSSLDETMLLDIHDCSQGYILFFFFFDERSRKKATYCKCSISFPSLKEERKRRKVEGLMIQQKRIQILCLVKTCMVPL